MYKNLIHEDFNDFKGQYDKGVEKLNISSWVEFHNVIKKFNRCESYIWRGQREDWALRSTFDRRYKNDKIKLQKIFNNFKKRLRYLPNTHNINFSKENEIWAIGQHYGLPTPLLDWTEVPYFAAYFAFYKKGDSNQTKDRIVYALNILEIKRLLLKEKDPKTHEVLSIKRMVDYDKSYFTSEQNQRMINQKGVTTITLEGGDINSIVQKFYERYSKNGKNYNKVILAKILIPNEFRNECLSSLKSMNITHGTVFPDFTGAVEICEIDLDLDKYKVNSDQNKVEK